MNQACNSTGSGNVSLLCEKSNIFVSTIATTDVNSFNVSTTTDNNPLNFFSYYPDGIMSKEETELASFVIYQILTPVVCVIGIVGNLMSLVVINKTKDRQAFSNYLKALTTTDTLILFSGLARFTCSVLSTHIPASSSRIKAYCEYIVNNGFAYTFLNLSSSLIAVMSIERLVAVVFPFNIKGFLFEKYSKGTITGVVIIQLIFCLPSVIWTEVVAAQNNQTNTTFYYVTYTPWAKDLSFRRYFSIILIIVNLFLPIIAVTVANIAICITLKRHKKTNVANATRSTEREAEERRITITLAAISVFYFFTVIPRLVLYVYTVSTPDIITIRRREKYFYDTVQDALVWVICLNAANDFIIYILASKRFRQLFQKQFVVWRSKSTTEAEQQKPL